MLVATMNPFQQQQSWSFQPPGQQANHQMQNSTSSKQTLDSNGFSQNFASATEAMYAFNASKPTLSLPIPSSQHFDVTQSSYVNSPSATSQPMHTVNLLGWSNGSSYPINSSLLNTNQGLFTGTQQQQQQPANAQIQTRFHAQPSNQLLIAQMLALLKQSGQHGKLFQQQGQPQTAVGIFQPAPSQQQFQPASQPQPLPAHQDLNSNTSSASSSPTQDPSRTSSGGESKMARAREKQGGKWQKAAANHGRSSGLSQTGQGNQVIAFKHFLEEEHRKGVVTIEALGQPSGAASSQELMNPLGLRRWQVNDVDQWWEDVKRWFEDDPERFCFRAFFMMLRRFGFKPFNKAPAPASSGLDYGLKNKQARTHGYEYDTEVFERYCQSRKAIARYCPMSKKEKDS